MIDCARECVYYDRLCEENVFVSKAKLSQEDASFRTIRYGSETWVSTDGLCQENIPFSMIDFTKTMPCLLQ